MCSWNKQLPNVIGVGPQWATANVRQKATVVCEVSGSQSTKRLMDRHVSSSGAVVTIQPVRRRLQVSRLRSTLLRTRVQFSSVQFMCRELGFKPRSHRTRNASQRKTTPRTARGNGYSVKLHSDRIPSRAAPCAVLRRVSSRRPPLRTRL